MAKYDSVMREDYWMGTHFKEHCTAKDILNVMGNDLAYNFNKAPKHFVYISFISPCENVVTGFGATRALHGTGRGSAVLNHTLKQRPTFPIPPSLPTSLPTSIT